MLICDIIIMYDVLQTTKLSGQIDSVQIYPSSGLINCYPYCGLNETYFDPFVMVKLNGVERGVKTGVVCKALAPNMGDTESAIQLRDKLASTNFVFLIRD